MIISIYDAKVREEGYKMSKVDAIEDYIQRYKARGARNIYFLIVSSDFLDHPSPIANIPITYMPASILKQLVSLKIQNPRLINDITLRELFEPGLLLTEDFIRDWCDRWGITTIDTSGLLHPTTVTPSEAPIEEPKEYKLDLLNDATDLKEKFQRLREEMLSWSNVKERVTKDWTYYEYVATKTIGFATINTNKAITHLRVFLKYCNYPDPMGWIQKMKYGFPYWFKFHTKSDLKYAISLVRQSYDYVSKKIVDVA